MGLAIASYMTSGETVQEEFVKLDKSSKPIYLVKFDKKIVGYIVAFNAVTGRLRDFRFYFLFGY